MIPSRLLMFNEDTFHFTFSRNYKGPGRSSLQSTEAPEKRMRSKSFFYADFLLLTNLKLILKTENNFISFREQFIVLLYNF